ncbi:SH3 domain-binding protein 4 [Lampetra fluviatilis]
MAANRIRAATGGGLPRCKSEGTLIDLEDQPSEPNFHDLDVPSPNGLLDKGSLTMENAHEVVAIKDYCPNSFTTLKFSKGERLYVMDNSRSEWWYAHNNKEMGYIPASYVRPVGSLTSTYSDSGMVDHIPESNGYKQEMDLLSGWPEIIGKQTNLVAVNGNPFRPNLSASNPFLNDISLMSTGADEVQKPISSTEWFMFDALKPSSSIKHNNKSATDLDLDFFERPVTRGNPFTSSKNRCYSMSELSVLQEQAQPSKTSQMNFTSTFKSMDIESFKNDRDAFRTAWLNRRKLARSCHDLGALEQSPGWGQTQPVETHMICRLDSSGGVVQLPDTDIVIHIPEGHVDAGEDQEVSVKALLEPPLELNSDRCTTVSPLIEIRLNNLDVHKFFTLEMSVDTEIKDKAAKIVCMRSSLKDSSYINIPTTYTYGNTIQVQLEDLGPCTYVVAVAQASSLKHPSTIWDCITKHLTVGVYGPRHIHPSFTTVVAMFGHNSAPKSLTLNEITKGKITGLPLALQLWGKYKFPVEKPQDVSFCLFSNDANFEVKRSGQNSLVRGFQMKLGMVSRIPFSVNVINEEDMQEFTLCVQFKDDKDTLLSQFCIQTPQVAPKPAIKTGQRRFLKKKEVGKIVLSPTAITAKYPTFQDRLVPNLKYAIATKTVTRQQKHPYLLEYKKGDMMVLLSEERVRVRGQIRNKDWFVGFYDGKLGLVHCRNVLQLDKDRSGLAPGPKLTTAVLLEQMLQPCKFLTYVYSSVRTQLMENIGSWRTFADSLGYAGVPLSEFCRVEVENEAEKVACVLEKLKEDCNCTLQSKKKKSFQKELFTALLKIDCQGLVARLLQDFVLLTTAVEAGTRWRELAEKLSKATRQQMDAFEVPHRDKNGEIDDETMWKPAYAFLLTWSARLGDSYRDVVQELHAALEKMRNPITKQWRHLTGTLLLIHTMDILRGAAFSSPSLEDSTT